MTDFVFEPSSVSSYSDTIELVYREFEKCLDLDLALSIISFPDGWKERLENDPILIARTNLYESRVREELIGDLRSLSKYATSEGVRLAAIKELGRTIYPKRFKEDAIAIPVSRTIKYEVIEN